MLIRAVTSGELMALAKIDAAVNLSPWSLADYQQSLANSQHSVVGIFNSSHEILGASVFSHVADQGELLQLCVQHQRQGYARQLLNFMAASLAVRGIKDIFLEVRVNNHAAIKLYHSLNFNQVGIRKNYYLIGNQRLDALLMVKTLCL